MKDIQAQQDYGMDSYETSYGKDNYKSKDSNKIVKKINCNNINVNVNGLELNGLPPALTSLLTGGEATDEGQYGDSSFRSGYGNGQPSYDNNSFKFVCINNNNNTVVFVNETTPEPEPEPPITSLTVNKEIFGC